MFLGGFYHLVDKQLKMCGTSSRRFFILDILRKCFALDIDEDPMSWVRELDHDEWGLVSLLV